MGPQERFQDALMRSWGLPALATLVQLQGDLFLVPSLLAGLGRGLWTGSWLQLSQAPACSGARVEPGHG